MHRTILRSTWPLCVLAVAIAATASVRALGGTGIPVSRGARSGVALFHDVSAPLRTMALIPAVPCDRAGEMEDRNVERVLRTTSETSAIDAALQSTVGPDLMPDPILSFEGVGNVYGVLPPDPMLAVGPRHIVAAVNVSFEVFDKRGVSVLGPTSTVSLWQGLGGPCSTTNDGDPVVLHDQIADRWVISQFTAEAPYGECVAVSASPDPTGAWYRYYFQFSTTDFYDYPKLGVWPDAYYLTMLRLAGGVSVIALDRAKMLRGEAATYQLITTASDEGVLLPADLDGVELPPPGTPAYLLGLADTTHLHLYRMRVNWTDAAGTTLTGPTPLGIAAFNALCPTSHDCITQPATAVRLDGLGDRLMNRLAYRNLGDHETLVASHSVDAHPGSTVRAGVRWYEIRVTDGVAGIFQQGTYAPDTTSRWMGSAAMDAAGDLAIGYNVSSAAIFPGVRYAGRLASDPPGKLPRAEATLVEGAGSQTHVSSRWGDYSTLVIDPVDDCTFWYASQYMLTTGAKSWTTRIGSFRFPGCSAAIPKPVPDGRFVPGSPMRVGKNATSGVDLSWGVTGCASDAYDLYWGSLGSFGSLTGAVCGLPPSGTATGVAVPQGSFFVLTGSAAGRIAPFGHAGSGAEESFSGWPSLCSEIQQIPGAVCN